MGQGQQALLRGKTLTLPTPVAVQQQPQQQDGRSASGTRSAGVEGQDSVTGEERTAGGADLHTAASKTAEALKADAVGGSVLAGAQHAQHQVLAKYPAHSCESMPV